MQNINYYLNSQLKYKRAVPLIVSILITRDGQKKAMKQTDILVKIHKKIPEFTSRMLRMAVHEIRVKHLIPGLVADNSGFYIETNPVNLLKYIARIDGYIKSQTAAKKAIIKDLMILNTQKKFPNKRHPQPKVQNRLLSRALGTASRNSSGTPFKKGNHE